jgi:hypothetical protein
LKDSGSLFGLIKRFTKANGGITKCMVKEYSLGPTAGGMKDSILTIKNKDLELLSGQTGEFMKDSGNRATSTDKGSTKEKMVSGSQATGRMERGSDELHFL